MRAAVRAADREHDIIRGKNLALYIRDCVSLCLSDETLKAVGPFYSIYGVYICQGKYNIP